MAPVELLHKVQIGKNYPHLLQTERSIPLNAGVLTYSNLCLQHCAYVRLQLAAGTMATATLVTSASLNADLACPTHRPSMSRQPPHSA